MTGRMQQAYYGPNSASVHPTYTGGTYLNYGFMIKQSGETTGSNLDYNVIRSAESGTQSMRPLIVINLAGGTTTNPVIPILNPVTKTVINGTYYLTNFYTEKALSYSGSSASTSQPAAVNSQKWKVVYHSQGYTIHPYNDSKKCLVLNASTKVVSLGTYTSTLFSNQLWEIRKSKCEVKRSITRRPPPQNPPCPIKATGSPGVDCSV